VALVEHILVPPVLVAMPVGLLRPDWVMVLLADKPLTLAVVVARVLVAMAMMALLHRALLAA
jgi:hypothetical protein